MLNVNIYVHVLKHVLVYKLNLVFYVRHVLDQYLHYQNVHSFQVFKEMIHKFVELKNIIYGNQNYVQHVLIYHNQQLFYHIEIQIINFKVIFHQHEILNIIQQENMLHVKLDIIDIILIEQVNLYYKKMIIHV